MARLGKTWTDAIWKTNKSFLKTQFLSKEIEIIASLQVSDEFEMLI